MRILLIVAAGKSSRFGGFPKAFCKIGNVTVIENTIEKAAPYYDRVYLGVNKNIYNEYKGTVQGCEMFSIVTGQGDAHSLLKCIMYIYNKEKQVNQNKELNTIHFCWGDAFFKNSIPFKQFCLKEMNSCMEVACSIDKNPYAWFEVEDGYVVKSHFAKDGDTIDLGIHDQCLFRMNIEYGIKYLNEYREVMGIPLNNDENVIDNNEMKLLRLFEYLREKNENGAKVIMIDSGNIVSFNTKEELDKLIISM